jgi:protein-disulfide isomerase
MNEEEIMRAKRNLSGLIGLLGCLCLLAACQSGASKEDIAEIKKQQRLILAKLGEMEKKLERAPAARPARRKTGPDPSKAYELPVGDSPIRGPENAPVTIVEFSDYQCPFCARSEPLIKDVMKEYPGKVRFVYKNLPLVSIHSNAMGAAQAAVAAGKQGKYWEMHDLLFANQRALQPDKLKEYAQQLGLDIAKFEADMNSSEVKSAIQNDMNLSRKVGVRGTPTIFVNGKLVENRSVDGLKQMIDPVLQKGAG